MIKIKVAHKVYRRRSVIDPNDFLLAVAPWFPGADSETTRTLEELSRMVIEPMWSYDVTALGRSIGLEIS